MCKNKFNDNTYYSHMITDLLINSAIKITSYNNLHVKITNNFSAKITTIFLLTKNKNLKSFSTNYNAKTSNI